MGFLLSPHPVGAFPGTAVISSVRQWFHTWYASSDFTPGTAAVISRIQQ
jgi:hypothetical protein